MTQALQVQWLAQRLGAQLVGRTDTTIEGVMPLHRAQPCHLSFFADPRQRRSFENSQAGAMLVKSADLPAAPGRSYLVVENPAAAASEVAQLLTPAPAFAAGIHPRAWVDATAYVDASASVGPNAVVEAHAHIAAYAIVEAQAYVGEHAQLGAHVHLHPGARVLHRCRIGARSILQAGAVVGSDGFGYVQSEPRGRRAKVPQLGIVVVGEDVEIGSNATIDRATFGATTVGDGSKIDNLVMVGHNVELGQDCVLVAQTGIAGSTTLGAGVIAGAQSGFVGHVQVAAGCHFAARSGVTKDIAEAAVYAGMPATRHRAWARSLVAARHFEQLQRTVAHLQRAAAERS